MKKWQLTLYCVVIWSGGNAGSKNEKSLIPGKNVFNIIPEFLGQTSTTPLSTLRDLDTEIPMYSGAASLEESQIVSSSAEISSLDIPKSYDSSSDPPDPRYPVQHAGLPLGLAVYPLPLKNSDHELMLNVSWQPATGPPARDYSVEIRSVTDTVDCSTPMCYEYNIPGDSLWSLVPAYTNGVAEQCAVRPGCAYRVRLIAHPWDGHTAANLLVELDECVAGVCSCAHAPRLPAPAVRASTVSVQGEIFVNVSWTLPPPRFPQRLPPALTKQYYFVSIGKQMVSDAHPTPWYAHTISRKVDADGPVATGDDTRWLLLPIVERSEKRGDERGEGQTRTLVLDVKLLARVSLIDDRGCVGRAGNATAYDPAEANKIHFGTYVLWATFGGACVLAMIALLAVSARVVKRVLNAFRPAPASAPLEPLRRRPAWFQLQLRTIYMKIKMRRLKAGSFLARRLSIAVQRGNAASVLCTLKRGGPNLDHFLN